VELVLAMRQRHFARFGTWPHVVINHFARRRLDPNRPERDGACDDAVEANLVGVRDDAENRDRFGDATAIVLEQFLSRHWGLALRPGAAPDRSPSAPGGR
jgi:hypothetical protein